MKTAVVLGASGALGSAITLRLLDRGYRVIGTWRSTAVTFDSDRVEMHELDLADAASIEDFAAAIRENETIDFFTSTIASPVQLGRFEDLPMEKFEHDMRVNVLGHVRLLRGLIPAFNKDSALVFVLTKLLFDENSSFWSSYVITKYALMGLMRTLSGELAGRGIRVNAVSPGMMDTNFTASLPSFLRQTYLQESERMTTPDEVAEEMMGFLTGTAVCSNISVFT